MSPPSAKKAAAPSGLEMMLRSMGLGDVIGMARQLATSGTIEKVLKFADGLEELNERLERIERLLAPRSGDVEPGSHATARRTGIGVSAVLNGASPGEHFSD